MTHTVHKTIRYIDYETDWYPSNTSKALCSAVRLR